jgi:hypothetical protein
VEQPESGYRNRHSRWSCLFDRKGYRGRFYRSFCARHNFGIGNVDAGEPIGDQCVPVAGRIGISVPIADGQFWRRFFAREYTFDHRERERSCRSAAPATVQARAELQYHVCAARGPTDTGNLHRDCRNRAGVRRDHGDRECGYRYDSNAGLGQYNINRTVTPDSLQAWMRRLSGAAFALRQPTRYTAKYEYREPTECEIRSNRRLPRGLFQ